MRVNARFDQEAEQQILYLAEVTGMGVSDVLRTSVRLYYEAERARRGSLRHLSALVGAADSGRTDVASTYKDRLATTWGKKYERSRPAAPRRAAEPDAGDGA